MTTPSTTGPLAGIRVIEFAGIGPTPYATMILAELGADVIRIERPGADQTFGAKTTADLLNRGKRSIALDLKAPADLEKALELVAASDIVVEGYRPGVAERIGIGPEACLERNPRVIYGRMTGWGQHGPLVDKAGHDINYIAITGALHSIGPAGGPPVIPLNLVGDFGGGSLYLVVGILAAHRHALETGHGQVVDAAIVDGAAHLLGGIHGLFASGQWSNERGTNPLDGGAAYYGVYETADGEYMSVGAIENKFFRELMRGLDLDPETPQHQNNGELKTTISAAFKRKTLSDWIVHFENFDACVAPVLGLIDAADDPHMAARGSLVKRDGIVQSAPAPRFSLTPTTLASTAPAPGAHTDEVLAELAQLRGNQA